MSSHRFKVLMCLAPLTLSGCFTPKKEKEIKDQIFEVKTKLMELEKVSQEKGQTVDVSRRNIASTHTEIERINVELQRIKGELESLKIATKTGEIPGSDPEADSVGKRIRDLEARVEAVELGSSTKSGGAGAGAGAAGAAKVAPSDPKKISVNEIRSSFNNKKFSFVIANAEGVLQRLKTKGTKEEVAYYEAESLFRLSRYREAALKFADFGEQYSGSARISYSKLRLGDCFKQLGDAQAAKSYYKEILTKYPKSEEANKAKENLDALESKGASHSVKPAKTKYSTSTPNEGRRRG